MAPFSGAGAPGWGLWKSTRALSTLPFDMRCWAVSCPSFQELERLDGGAENASGWPRALSKLLPKTCCRAAPCPLFQELEHLAGGAEDGKGAEGGHGAVQARRAVQDVEVWCPPKGLALFVDAR